MPRIPPPSGDPEGRLRGLIYDAKPDPHRGVICHARLVDGSFKRGDQIDLIAVGRKYLVTEVCKFTP